MTQKNNTTSWFQNMTNRFFQWLNKSSLPKVKVFVVVPITAIGFSSVFVSWAEQTGFAYRNGDSKVWEAIIIGLAIFVVVYFDYDYFIKKFNSERVRYNHEYKLALIEVIKDESVSEDIKKEVLKKI